MLSFKGKVCIITGASGGLGRKYALDLAARGASVVVNDTNTDKVEAVVREIVSTGGVAYGSVHSVLDGSDIVKDTMKQFGNVDVLVNNAGILRDKSFHKMTKHEWREVIDVHLNGTFELCHSVWPIMRDKQHGRIVNIASGAGLYGNFGQANYSASKMGIIGLTNTLAIEGSKYDIRANCVIPIAASQMTENVIPSEYLDLLKPDHVVGIVSYLAHGSSDVNGEAFEVGGGWYSKIRWERSKGISLGTNDTHATAEDVSQNFKSICDFDQSSHPLVLSDSLQAMIQNNMEKNEKNGKKNDKKNEKMDKIDKFFDNSSTKLIDDHVDKSVEPITQEVLVSEEILVSVVPKVVSQSEQLFIEMSNFFDKNPDKVVTIAK